MMNLSGTISSAKKKKYLIISRDELDNLLSQSKIVIEENTYISDKIRLLNFNNDFILQEKTTKDEYIIRIMKTKEKAKELIKERLEIYNRMWDGCGCRIHYYD
jgi:hypothetical protein